MGFFNNPVKDATKIQKEINYEILRAAWDGYVRIKKTGFQKTHGMATPAWFALFAVQNHKGKFEKFDVDEIHLLKAFSSVHDAYDEIIKELSEHNSDEHLAEYIISTHPNLVDIVPDEYKNTEKLNEYIVLIIKKYQAMLEEYYERYKDKINANIERLEKEPANDELETEHEG